jgi:hypothetical protein
MSEFLGALREPHHGFSEFCGALGLFLFAGVCHRLFLTAFFLPAPVSLLSSGVPS